MSDLLSTRIARVEAWKCRFELPVPFTLGKLTISHREYVVVRVITAGGVEGVSFGLTRGAPIDVIVTELLASHLIGFDIAGTESLTARMRDRLPQHALEGLMLRAFSHVDIACWDIKGKAAGEPAWKLLGGRGGDTAPVMLVEGYHKEGEDDSHFASRLASRAQQGYVALKVEASSPDLEMIAARLAATREAVGEHTDLMIDLAYGWSGAQDFGALANWLDPGLAWAEDPLHGNDVEGLKRIHSASAAPLAVGDEVTSPSVLRALIDARAIDILRVDITCIGGLSAVAGLQRDASDAGISMSTHVYPQLHQHVVFAYPEGGYIEMFPDNGLWDTSEQFVQPLSTRRDATGVMVVDAPSEPGLGLMIDWSAIELFTTRHTSVGAP